MSFPYTPKPQLIISWWPSGSFLFLPLLKPFFPLESPLSTALVTLPVGTFVPKVCHYLPPLHVVRPSQEASHSLAGRLHNLGESHGNAFLEKTYFTHSLVWLALMKPASQAQFESRLKATSYRITWFTCPSVLPRGSCMSHSILHLLPQVGVHITSVYHFHHPGPLLLRAASPRGAPPPPTSLHGSHRTGHVCGCPCPHAGTDKWLFSVPWLRTRGHVQWPHSVAKIVRCAAQVLSFIKMRRGRSSERAEEGEGGRGGGKGRNKPTGRSTPEGLEEGVLRGPNTWFSIFRAPASFLLLSLLLEQPRPPSDSLFVVS